MVSSPPPVYFPLAPLLVEHGVPDIRGSYSFGEHWGLPNIETCGLSFVILLCISWLVLGRDIIGRFRGRVDKCSFLLRDLVGRFFFCRGRVAWFRCRGRVVWSQTRSRVARY